MLPLRAPGPDMCVHLWPDRGAGDFVAVGAAAADPVVADCDELVRPAVLVEALAMVRPRARLAPSAPAATAVPMSGQPGTRWAPPLSDC